MKYSTTPYERFRGDESFGTFHTRLFNAYSVGDEQNQRALRRAFRDLFCPTTLSFNVSLAGEIAYETTNTMTLHKKHDAWFIEWEIASGESEKLEVIHLTVCDNAIISYHGVGVMPEEAVALLKANEFKLEI